MNTKEQVYDTEIYPLMDQIIKLCQQHKIAMLCTFDITPSDEGKDTSLLCTTALVGGDYKQGRGRAVTRALLAVRPDIAASRLASIAVGGHA